MHPAIAINTLSLAPADLSSLVDSVARIGARAISPDLEPILAAGAAAATKLLRDADLEIATLTHRAFGFATHDQAKAGCQRLTRTIGIAAEIGANSVIMTTGGRGDLAWADAVSRFADAVVPCVEQAHAAGIRLGIEPTSHLYADASIAHRLSDTVAIAQRAGLAVMIDIFACWADSDIDQAIATAAPLCPLVQISDYVYKDRGLPCRAVPGDGAIRFDRIIPALVQAGFSGWYDLEIIGPRLQSEGQESGLRRAADHIGRLIEKASV
ncbi:MAG: hypothetical protein RL367_2336 [Pseudomonadota bacterium]|jgi:sugar phosphate isomerase/epimerase